MSKDAFRATMSAMILTISIARSAGYAAVGELTLDSVILCAASLPAMGLGLLIGDRIHTGLSPLAFQRFVCIALARGQDPFRRKGAGSRGESDPFSGKRVLKIISRPPTAC